MTFFSRPWFLMIEFAEATTDEKESFWRVTKIRDDWYLSLLSSQGEEVIMTLY
jgi:hypothetical protein